MARKPSLVAVDFFCCAGGVTCGFRQAGIKVLGGIDIDGSYKKTYEKNNEGSKFIKADISRLRYSLLEKKLRIRPNMDNLIFVGCSPCQYYTGMQTNKNASAKGKLLLEEFRRFVAHFKPGYIFIENVPGIETKEESPLTKFKEFLKEQQYSLDDTVVNAADYNVPQSRKRYVLVASRVKSKSKIRVPAPSRAKVRTVRDAIGDLQPIPAKHKDQKLQKHWSAEIQEINLRRLRATPAQRRNTSGLEGQ